MFLRQFIFSSNYSYRIVRHVAFWTGRLCIRITFLSVWWSDTLQMALNDVGKAINHYLPFMLIVEIPSCYFVNYVLLPRFLLKNRYRLFIYSFMATMLVTLMWGVFYVHWYGDQPFSYFNFTFFWFFSSFFLTEWTFSCCIFLAFKLYKTMYMREEEKQMLVKANAQAETELLKAQIHPHFLFNTLNNIYAYTLDRLPKAEELVSSLSEILQYMVHDCNVEVIPLNKEIKMLQDYIELEKVRYGERLHIEVDIQGECEDKMIAPLLMIPFVENSFKHGASRLLTNPWIHLFIQADDTLLHFSLTNSKPPGETVNGRKGIGLINVNKRLQLLYAAKHLLRIESTVNSFSVNMQVPLRKTKEIKQVLMTETATV